MAATRNGKGKGRTLNKPPPQGSQINVFHCFLQLGGSKLVRFPNPLALGSKWVGELNILKQNDLFTKYINKTASVPQRLDLTETGDKIVFYAFQAFLSLITLCWAENKSIMDWHLLAYSSDYLGYRRPLFFRYNTFPVYFFFQLNQDWTKNPLLAILRHPENSSHFSWAVKWVSIFMKWVLDVVLNFILVF